LVTGYKIIIILEPHMHGKLRSDWRFRGHDIYDNWSIAFGASNRFMVFATSKTSVMIVLVRNSVIVVLKIKALHIGYSTCRLNLGD